jgi:hypothetical protein
MMDAKDATGIEPGDPEFLGALQNALTLLWDGQPPKDREEYFQAAKEWSENHPPKHIQSR